MRFQEYSSGQDTPFDCPPATDSIRSPAGVNAEIKSAVAEKEGIDPEQFVAFAPGQNCSCRTVLSPPLLNVGVLVTVQ